MVEYTTVPLTGPTKADLDAVRRDDETYDQVLRRLIDEENA